MMALIDGLFPKVCFGCGRIGAYVCSDCLNKIRVLDNQFCPECNQGNVAGLTHPRCRKRWGLAGLVSVMAYSGLVKAMIMAYKYKWVESLTDDLVELTISLGDLSGLKRQPWLVVAVPLHPRRERWRGFNQAAELAIRVAEYGRWDYLEKGLKRVRYTKPQMSLPKKERETNMVGAFEVGKGVVVKQRPVLLVDDVWTTGATMRESGKVLRRAGAMEVWGLTLARAV